VVAVEQSGAGWGLDMCLQLGPRTKMNHHSDGDKPIPTLCSPHSLDCSKMKNESKKMRSFFLLISFF
jgi:hypothetical protein